MAVFFNLTVSDSTNFLCKVANKCYFLGNIAISCPECKNIVKVQLDAVKKTHGLDLNRLLQNLVEKHKSALGDQESSDGVTEVSINGDSKKSNECDVMKCDMCEDESAAEVASKFCVECKVLYCETCFTQCHRMKGPFATHNIQVFFLLEYWIDQNIISKF